MNVRQQLVGYARQIAIYRGYTNLVNGLQPWEVLVSKRQHKMQELLEAQETKTPLHVLHEAADFLYYSACMAEQDQFTASRVIPENISQWAFAYAWLSTKGVNVQQAEKAALAKYAWSAAAPGNKDESHELALIQDAITKESQPYDDVALATFCGDCGMEFVQGGCPACG